MADQTLQPRLVTLVVHEPRGVLDPFEVVSPWKMESSPVVAAAKDKLGVEVVVIRMLDGDGAPGGPVTYLVEAPGIDPNLVRPIDGVFTGDAWGVEQPLRPQFARPGGIGELTSWIDHQLAVSDAERIGAVTQIRTWNLSCLLRVESTIGRLWLKVVPSFFAHEGALIRLLAQQQPELVPGVVATEPGVVLMADTQGIDGYDVEEGPFLSAVTAIGSAMASVDESSLRDAGVPSLTLDDFMRGLQDVASRHAGDLSEPELAGLATLIDEAPDRWVAAGDRTQLVHGDLHGGNLSLRADGSSVVIDWGDAALTHPLMELAVLDSYQPPWAAAVVDPWLEVLGRSRADWRTFQPLASARLAITYRMFCDRIEPSEQVYHLGDIVPAVRRSIAGFVANDSTSVA